MRQKLVMNEMEIKKENIQKSESFHVAALLAVSGGLLDAYTYLCRGGVFANAQTGNIVLLGINLAAGNWAKALTALVPISAFVDGILITELIKSRFKTDSPHALHWRHAMLGLEMLLLTVAAFVPIGTMDRVVNIIVSLVCALQVQTFRKVHGYSFASTMCTGNLRNGTEAFFEYAANGKNDAKCRCLYSFGVIVFFIIGAALGAFVSSKFPSFVLVVAILIYLAVFLLMTRWDRLTFQENF